MHPDLIILIETRVKGNKAGNIRNKLGNKWSYIDNYNNHANGKIRIVFDEYKIKAALIHITTQLIHLGVYSTAGIWQYWCTAIYALNTLLERNKLWDDIEKLQPPSKKYLAPRGIF